MTLAEFVDNLADLNDGDNFSRDILCDIYQSIRDEPIEFDLLVHRLMKPNFVQIVTNVYTWRFFIARCYGSSRLEI
jgi:hypothetical protein